MVDPRTDEKRLPVAGIPGKSPVCVPDFTHSLFSPNRFHLERSSRGHAENNVLSELSDWLIDRQRYDFRQL
jgi:hypothetical protein